MVVLSGFAVPVRGADVSTAPSGVALRWDFAGGGAMASETRAPGLRSMASSAGAGEVAAMLSTNLAGALVALGGGEGAGRGGADAVAPVVLSLLQRETAGEIRGKDQWLVAWRGGAGEVPQAALALSKIFGTEAVVSVDEGWTLAQPKGGTRRRAELPIRQPGDLLRVEADTGAWPAGWWPGHVVAAPRAVLRAGPTNGTVRSELVLSFPSPLGMRLDAWKIPPQVRSPIVGFGAFRGVESLLSKAEWYRYLQVEETPNQVFTWSLPAFGTRQYYAFRAEHPAAYVDRVAERLKGHFAPVAEHPVVEGTFRHGTNDHGWNITGIPASLPAMFAMQHPTEGGWVYGGLFTGTRQTNPPPAGMIAQLERPDLVGYVWEELGEGFTHWRNALQLRDVLMRRPVAGVSDPANSFFETVTSQLKDSATRIRLEAPSTLVVTRNSEVGLSGFEMAVLGRWLDLERNARVRMLRGTRVPATKASARP